MNQIIVSNKKRFFLNSKLLFFSVLQFILFFTFIAFLSKTILSFTEYSWGINEINPKIPLGVENDRILFLFSLTLWILVTFIVLGTSIKNKNIIDKKFLCSFLISWIFIPVLIKKIYENKDLKNFRGYSRLDDGQNCCINHKIFIKCLRNKENKNKVFYNTLFFYITFVILLIGFILIFVKKNHDNDPESLFMIDKLSYFTNISNIFCFLYLLGMFFLFKSYSFKNNIWLINLSSYIVVVGLIYWCFLFPTSVVVDSDVGTLKILRGVWLHTINPIFFVVFSIHCFNTNKNKEPKLGQNILIGSIYPLWYGLYIYSLPFLVRVSIYGFITNPNPYLILYGDSVPKGNAWSILSILGFGVIFVFFFFVFNKINKKLFVK